MAPVAQAYEHLRVSVGVGDDGALAAQVAETVLQEPRFGLRKGGAIGWHSRVSQAPMALSLRAPVLLLRQSDF